MPSQPTNTLPSFSPQVQLASSWSAAATHAQVGFVAHAGTHAHPAPERPTAQ
jgi:hypothetical protein